MLKLTENEKSTILQLQKDEKKQIAAIDEQNLSAESKIAFFFTIFSLI